MDKKPGDFRYIFSFWAFDTLQKGTIPYAVTCYKSVLNNYCAIATLSSENTQNDSVFHFYVYQKNVFGSQQIYLKSKSVISKKSTGTATNTEDSYLSFWAPTLGKQFGNIFICRCLR